MNHRTLSFSRAPGRACLVLPALLGIFALAPVWSGAQTPAPSANTVGTGIVAGRVLNARTNQYLENARVRLAGTGQETFTDAEGRFVLAEVAAGAARVQVFYTGLGERSEEIAVEAGRTASPTIVLGRTDLAGDEPVKLDTFVVTASRVMEGAAVAINEQRFSANIKNVLSTDEFGFLAEGNAAEFLKFMPGITIDNVGGNARDISLNGVPSAYVPVTIEGFNLASAGVEMNMGRSVAMDMVSVNNLSRIEVIHSPQADSSGTALAGSVNMVPRSAFERARPVFNYRAFLMGRASEFDLDKTPGPDRTAARKVNPGFELSWIAPVSDWFGYTVTAGYSENYSPEPLSQARWHGTFAATAAPGTVNPAFPATTPDQPYLTNYVYRDAGKLTQRGSLGTTLDFRLGRYDRISLGLQYSHFDLIATNQTLEFPIDRVATFTTTATTSAAGQGRLQLTNLVRHRINETFQPSVVWYHHGPQWRAKVGLGNSKSTNENRDINKGAFSNTTATMTNVTVSYADINYLRPDSITVVNNVTGQVIDPFAIAGKNLISAGSVQDDVAARQLTAYADLERTFDWRLPIKMKAGLRYEQQERENTGTTSNWTFLGPDLNATTLESAAPFLDSVYAARSGQFGLPAIQGVDNYLAYDRLRTNPEQFRLDENAQYRSRISNSKRAQETIASGYLQSEIGLFNNRLKLIGGVRAEQTNIEASGALQDPTRNYQRDAAGNVLRGTNGLPLLIVPTTNALGVSQLTFIERGTNASKEYLRVLPRFNASYQLTEQLIARASYSTSLGRPNLNQYAGALTLPDIESPPGTNNFIFVNNPNIKAWNGEAFAVRLEYYFQKVGQVSVGAFRRNYENFFGSVRTPATPEFLAAFELDPVLYGPYEVSTQVNVPGRVQQDGITIDYKQALTFLPDWARGVQVFANASRIVRDGPVTLVSNLNPARNTASWGVSLTRKRFTTRFNWNYRASRINSLLAGNSIGPETYNYTPTRLTLDADGEFYFRKNLALFVNVRNLTDEPEVQEIYGPDTPAHARLRLYIPYGTLWTFGIKGSF